MEVVGLLQNQYDSHLSSNSLKVAMGATLVEVILQYEDYYRRNQSYSSLMNQILVIFNQFLHS